MCLLFLQKLGPVGMQVTVRRVLWNVCKNIERKDRPDTNDLFSIERERASMLAACLLIAVTRARGC